MIRPRSVFVLLLAAIVVACSASQSRFDLQLTAITAGCKVSLDLERDAGAAGAADDTARGCEAALRTLDHVPAATSAAPGAAPAPSSP
jgi:hypothetical protein